MIILREFRVSDDGQYLIIDVKANEALAGVYLDSMEISCDGTFTDAYTAQFINLINVAIDGYTNTQLDWGYDYITEVRYQIPLNKSPYVFGNNKTFYLKVTAQDPQNAVKACGLSSTLKTTTFYKYPLYKNIACAAHQMDGCEPPQAFVDYLMRLKALEASIAIGDTESINTYFAWLIEHANDCESAISTTPSKSGCGCHS